MSDPQAMRTPWHLWAVGIVGVLWNGFGCYDYVMSKTAGEAYLRAMGLDEAMIAYFNAMPLWMTAAWAIGVWGALAGAVLLLLRSKWAVAVFAASLIAYVVSLVYTYLLSEGGSIMPDGMWMMQVVILAACVFFTWYALAMRKTGVLR